MFVTWAGLYAVGSNQLRQRCEPGHLEASDRTELDPEFRRALVVIQLTLIRPASQYLIGYQTIPIHSCAAAVLITSSLAEGMMLVILHSSGTWR